MTLLMLQFIHNYTFLVQYYSLNQMALLTRQTSIVVNAEPYKSKKTCDTPKYVK